MNKTQNQMGDGLTSNHKHDARVVFSESENQAGIRRCSTCGIITINPYEDEN